MDLIMINEKIAERKYKGYNPTHIRIHPNTFKKIISPMFGTDIEIDKNKRITLLGLIVWLDETMNEESCCVYDMDCVMRSAMVMHDFIEYSEQL
jgi:hypothetical protein